MPMNHPMLPSRSDPTMARRTRTALAWPLLFALMASCAAPTVRAYAGYTEMQLGGSIALEPTLGGVSLGTTQNNVEELGLDDDYGSPYARVEVGLGLPRLTVSAFQFEEEGTGQLQASFGNIIAGTTVRSSMDITSAKAALTFDFLNGITAGLVRVSPGIAVHAMDVKLAVSDSGSLITEDVDELVALPLPFVQAEVDVGWVAVTGEVGWIALDVEDVDGEFLDVELMLRLNPAAHFELFGGYRYLSLDVAGVADGQDFDTDLDLSGWMVGGGITF